uniref:C2H2-type domain-containing protein n=1 Tax=Stomoxys calcitrans TaxID=35570 RepID=A0A1I8P0V6_STOCA
MAGPNTCSLCMRSCNSSLRLYDKNGHFNDVYNITIKFFKPEDLGVQHKHTNRIAVLCTECWRQISGFHSFQNTVRLLKANVCNVTEKENDANTVSEMGSLKGVKVEDSLVVCNGREKENDVFKNVKVEDAVETITIDDDIADVIEVSKESKSHEISLYQDFNNSEKSLKETFKVEKAPSTNLSSGQIIVTDCEIKFSTNTNHMNASRNVDHSDYEYTDNNQLEQADEIFVADESENGDQDSISSADSLYKPFPGQRKAKRSSKRNSQEPDFVIAKWMPMLDCYVCQAQFPIFSDLKCHMEVKHPANEVYVTCCNRRFKFRCLLEEHAIMHLYPRGFECSQCKNSFRSRSSLAHHKQNIHKGKTSKCQFCSQTFAGRSSLYSHLKQRHAEDYAKRKRRKS